MSAIDCTEENTFLSIKHTLAAKNPCISALRKVTCLALTTLRHSLPLAGEDVEGAFLPQRSCMT